MPADRSPRPVRLAASPSRHNNAGRPQRYAVENILASRAAPQPSAAPIVSVADHECLVPSPPLLTVADGLPSNTYPDQPQSSTFNQSTRFLLSTPLYREEQHPVHQSFQPEPTFPQATQPRISTSITHQPTPSYPAQSVNQHHSIDPPHRALYDSHHPTLPHPQAENVPQLGSLFEQPWSTSQPLHQPPSQPPSRLQHRGTDMFYKAHDFVVNHPVFVDNGSDNFMASFLKETIIGAEFDSSDRHMPLRCHPGTRLEVIKRCQDFILNREGRAKIQWVVGTAGVGKSAIMQSVAHDEANVLADIIIGATIFFSINGRQDGTKAITTIAYQLAVKLKLYRRFIQREVTDDPSLYRKSLSKQFDKFVVEPFIHQGIVVGYSQLLIILDGLDECANPSTQRELLGLITDFCIAYPTSPIVWMIASRPEPHIMSFFSQPKVALAYDKEEIVVDSDEAYEDVKRYLRDKFRQIQMESTTLQLLSQWPLEDDFLKIANASGGLFAYASTVVRYISDPDYGDPVRLLDDVLKIIETGTNEDIWGRNHPMAQLDALYAHIMSKIPPNVMTNTRKLLLLNLHDGLDFPFQFQCNMLGMTQGAAYGATHHIRSIASIPRPVKAAERCLVFSHKSFPDYLRNFERSGFSEDIKAEAEELWVGCVLRVLEGVRDGVYVDAACDKDLRFGSGVLRNGCSVDGSGDDICVSWPAVGEHGNCEMRLDMVCIALWECVRRFGRGEEAFRSGLCLKVLSRCFSRVPGGFPFDAVWEFAFDESRRCEFLEDGILKEVPLEILDYDAIAIHRRIQLRFKGQTVEQSNPWNSTCQHERKGSRSEGPNQDWSTTFIHPDAYSARYTKCRYCFERFKQHFDSWRLGGGGVVVVLDVTPVLRLVELSRVGDAGRGGGSEWVYWFFVGEGDCEDDGGENGDDVDGGGDGDGGESEE